MLPNTQTCIGFFLYDCTCDWVCPLTQQVGRSNVLPFFLIEKLKEELLVLGLYWLKGVKRKTRGKSSSHESYALITSQAFFAEGERQRRKFTRRELKHQRKRGKGRRARIWLCSWALQIELFKCTHCNHCQGSENKATQEPKDEAKLRRQKNKSADCMVRCFSAYMCQSSLLKSKSVGNQTTCVAKRERK